MRARPSRRGVCGGEEHRYLRGRGAGVVELAGRPAHLPQSGEEPCLDAWLENYDDHRLPTRSISDYNKGHLLGVLLDLQLREATPGAASIRDVFLWMNENYARKGQFFPEAGGVRRAAEAVSHSDLGWFFRKYVAGTDEIPWDDFFKNVGLHLLRRVINIADVGFVATRNFDAALVVSALTPGSAADLAGLAVGDSILAINGQKADRGFSALSSEVRPGDTLRLRVRNSAGERELHWKMGSRQEVELELADLDKVTAEQKARRAAWLKGEAQALGTAAP